VNGRRRDESKLGAPSPPEVWEQLQKMLGSPLFKGKDQESKVLRYLVEATMGGIEVREANIREDLFTSPPYNARSTIARYTVLKLRGTLEEYNADLGNEDMVIIALPRPEQKGRAPAGEAYKVRISYNPRNATNKSYAAGLHHASVKRLGNFLEGAAHFSKVLRVDENHIGARIGYADIMLKYFLVDGDGSQIEMVIDFMHRTVDIEKENWRARVVSGVALLFGRRVGQAKAEFNIALRLRRDLVCESGWYYFFLLATRDISEAEDVVRSAIGRDTLNIWAGVIYSAIAYFRGEIAIAYERLQESRYTEFNFWMVPFLGSLFCLENGDGGGNEELDETERLLGISKNEYFCGLRSLLVETTDIAGQEEARRACREKGDDRSQWFNLALCGIADGDMALARESLEKAWYVFDPRMLLIHLWPFFNPLRSYDWFKTLNAKRLIRPPASHTARSTRSDEI